MLVPKGPEITGVVAQKHLVSLLLPAEVDVVDFAGLVEPAPGFIPNFRGEI